MDDSDMIDELRMKLNGEKFCKEWVSPTLKRADEIINGERQDQYGDPEDSFRHIARFWNAYIRILQEELLRDWGVDEKDYCLVDILKPKDIAIMMSLMKHARMTGQKWHPDNATDACGYLAILNDRIMEGL